ncbi:MAG TPA: sensor histidine kinase [Verrucomicrobiae bacterium]|nr:sensor histidine kinase [Verrucomicrobiae bacterium]
MAALLQPAGKRTILRMLALWCIFLASAAVLGAEEEEVVTNAVQIRNLTYAEAKRPLPVRMRGVVVTEAGPPGNLAVVISDGSAGVYVLGPTNCFVGMHRGDLLEVEGVTDPGEFAPIIRLKSFRPLGTAPVPKPQEVTFEQMIAGSLDGQLVEVAGVVRSWEKVTDTNEFGVWHMELAVGGGRLTVSSNGEHPPGVERDAEVLVRGVCFYQFDDRRQVLSPLVLVSREVPIQIEKPAPADPFAAPVRSVWSLLQFSPSADYKHCVHTRGVVTYQEPGATVWLRDEVSGLQVQTKQSEELRPGDQIDVVGYVRYGAAAPVLEDALFRRSSSGHQPEPVKLLGATNAFDHEEDLVSLEAVLTDVQPVMKGWALTLQDGDTSFTAFLRRTIGDRTASEWQPRSRVKVSGICSVISSEVRPVTSGIWHPQSFQILMRSSSDLAVIRPPPWWTSSHIMLLFGMVASVSLIVAAFAMLTARRHLREQALRRAMAEAEFAAILSERNRVAREIHDTLAQGLAATSVQLMLAKKSANGASSDLSHHLDAAQELVRESLAEARDSIWNMRSHVLESSDLAGALKEILKQRCDGTGIETSVEVSGRSRRFAPIVENNVLRAGQEAIFNATKYAKAKKIVVRLEFGEKQLRLLVRDDGSGFDPANPPSGSGGFGLMAMRERATELKGELKMNSSPGQGTEVIFTVPLSGE